jgi:predicted secreted hydrolase
MRRLLATFLVALISAGCAGPILANPSDPPSTPIPTASPPPPPLDPITVELPRDDGPHDRLTEWWYYTGHLEADDGRTFGFEFVIFRAERGAFPTTWASHLAITDEDNGNFRYAQRSEIGAQVDRSATLATPGAEGFDLAISGLDLLAPESMTASQPWTMAGAGGMDRLTAIASGAGSTDPTAPFGIDLSLRATKPAALHDGDGWIDFGPAGGSYYYSRTSMAASGLLTLDGANVAVDGIAWFDHQWGDFISVGGSGWDWFAVNLEDGTDLTLSLVRDADGAYPLVHGTLVDAAGRARHLDREMFTVDVTETWTSPATGATYPAAWSITVPSEELSIRLRPTVPDQELDTRATTGVVYWEGSQLVEATHDGAPIEGRAYVELTGYAGR